LVFGSERDTVAGDFAVTTVASLGLTAQSNYTVFFITFVNIIFAQMFISKLRSFSFKESIWVEICGIPKGVAKAATKEVVDIVVEGVGTACNNMDEVIRDEEAIKEFLKKSYPDEIEEVRLAVDTREAYTKYKEFRQLEEKEKMAQDKEKMPQDKEKMPQDKEKMPQDKEKMAQDKEKIEKKAGSKKGGHKKCCSTLFRGVSRSPSQPQEDITLKKKKE